MGPAKAGQRFLRQTFNRRGHQLAIEHNGDLGGRFALDVLGLPLAQINALGEGPDNVIGQEHRYRRDQVEHIADRH